MPTFGKQNHCNMDYDIIKKLLKDRGMTFQELCDRMGVDRNNLYNSITKGNPTLSRLETIAEHLGVPVWRLFTESQEESEIYGVIVYKGTTHKIDSVPAYKALVNKIDETK